MSLLLLGVAMSLLALILHFWVGERLRRVALAALVIVYFAPAIFVASIFFSSYEELPRFRLALLGLGFRWTEGEPFEVEIGGDRERHDAWIAALEGSAKATVPVGKLVFDPPVGGDGPGLRLLSPPGPSSGLLAMRHGRSPLRPLRRLELAHGDAILVGGNRWRVDLETGLFGPPARFHGDSGAVVDLARRRTALPGGATVPVFKPLSATEATHPLQWLQMQVERSQPVPTANFLYRSGDGAKGSGLWIVSHDPAIQVERLGEPLPIPAEIGLRQGSRVHVTSPPRWREDEFLAGGIRDRRSFRVLHGRRSLALAFDTPEIYSLSLAELAELQVEQRADSGPTAATDEDQVGEAPLRVDLAMGSWQISARSLYFSHAGDRLAAGAMSTLELPANLETVGRADGAFSVTSPTGRRSGRLGTPLWLGSENLAAVQFDVISPPVLLGVLALVLALLKCGVAWPLGLTPPQVLVFGALEALVSLRLVLGFRAWASEPFSVETFELALVAWMFIPWALLMTAMRRIDRAEVRYRMGKTVPRWLPVAAGWCLSLAWSLRFSSGARSLVWLGLHLAVAAIPVIRSWGLLRRLAGDVEDLLERLASSPTAYRFWLGVSFGPLLLRGTLVFLGVKESVSLLGNRFAMSLPHVLLCALLQAAYLTWLWWRLKRRRQSRAWQDLLPAAGFVLFGWFLPALMVNDNGLALTNLPVLLIALVMLVHTVGKIRSGTGLGRLGKWRWTPVAALLLYLSLAAVPLGTKAFVGLFPERTERNFLKLLAFAYPERLEQVATRESERLAIMSTVMEKYTAAPMTGRGYLRTELSPHIPTTLREHATSVLVASEWGSAGAIGLLLTFLVMAMGAFSLPSWRSEALRGDPLSREPTEVWRALAFLSALSIAVPSIYMILANFQLTLFTGKNVYLLGLDSMTDVLESGALAVLFALCSSIVRDEERPR